MRQFINTLSRIGGEKIETFFKRRIADPIGMQSCNQVAALGAHYGYLWFTNDDRALLPAAPPDAFYHTGSGRPNRKTALFICPSLDLLALVATDKAVYDIDSAAAVNEWVSKILPAVKTA